MAKMKARAQDERVAKVQAERASAQARAAGGTGGSAGGGSAAGGGAAVAPQMAVIDDLPELVTKGRR